jgi:hypothetical protein
MDKIGYTMFTALGVCLIGAGLAFQILYIEHNQNDELGYLPHQIVSIIFNTTVVLYLLFNLMVYRPFESQMAIGGSLLALLAGFAMEIYSTQFTVSPAMQGVSYAFAGINALVRLYLLISIRCGSYTTSIPDAVKRLLDAAKVDPRLPGADKVASAVAREVASQGAQVSEVDPQRLYGNIMSGLGSLIPEDKRNEAKDAVKKGLGLPVGRPQAPQGGRRR